MISRIPRWLLPGVPMLALVLAACGGAAAPTATPTKAPATAPTATPGAVIVPTPTPIKTLAPTAPVSQPTASSGAKPTGNVTIVLADASVQALHPNLNVGNNPPYYFIYENVLGFDLESHVQGTLATAWEAKENATIWDFKLRPGVKFHNGDIMSAEDVKFSWDLMLTDPRSTGVGLWKPWIDQVEVVDPLTVRFRLKKPNSGLAYRIAAQAPYVGVVPKGYYQKVGVERFGKDSPIGTGPFKFLDRRLDEFMAFEAFEGYWRQAPFVKSAKVLIASEASVRLAMLKTREVDVMGGVTPLQGREIDGTPGLRTVRALGTGLMWMWTFGASTGQDSNGFNIPKAKSPWANKLVRQAANYAIDRDAIVKGIFSGEAEPMVTVVMPGAAGFNPRLKPYVYDPEKAKELLAQAGYAEGFVTDLYSTPHAAINFTEETTVAVANMWAKVGIKATVKKLDYGTYLRNVRERTIDGVGVIASSFQADGFVALDFWATNKGWGTGGISDHLNAGLDRAAAESDPTRREALIQDLVAQEYEMASNIYLVYGNTVYGLGSRVRQWQPQRGTPYLFRIDLLQLAQ